LDDKLEKKSITLLPKLLIWLFISSVFIYLLFLLYLTFWNILPISINYYAYFFLISTSIVSSLNMDLTTLYIVSSISILLTYHKVSIT